MRSAAALVVDANNGTVIFERGAGVVTPIASITKLMTALVVLDGQQPLDEVIKITADDRWKGKGAFSHMPVGAKLTRGDLLRLALMASENLAARTLARNYPGGIKAFVRTMNVKAKALGMTQHALRGCVRPVERQRVERAGPREAGDRGVAQVTDPGVFDAAHAGSAVRQERARVSQHQSADRQAGLDIVVQKTGYTKDAGQCLVMEAVIDERPVVMVFLNSFGK